MPLVTATGLAKSYGPQDVFEGLSFEIPHGAHIALLGPNGSGKTSLLRIIAGVDRPTAGEVYRAKGLRIAYLPQRAQLEGDSTLWEAMEEVFASVRAKAEKLRVLEEAMSDPDRRERAMARYGRVLEAFESAGGYTYQARIEQALAGLGFDEEDFHAPIHHLSGGQRTRALLARVLLEDPDLLLLDEPTNHLDLAGIEWLEQYLEAWPKAMVVVAHDRAFLDEVAQQVWELAFGQLHVYQGNYTHYVEQRQERRARQQELYERQQEKIERTEEFIRRYKAGQRSKQARGREKRLARLERLEAPREIHTMSLDLGQPLRSGDLVLGLHDLIVGYDEAAPLFTIDKVQLQRGQQVALLGPNGVGKTTLLRTILGQIEPLAGQIRLGAGVQPGYFAQAQAELDREKTILETILDAGLHSISRARDLLGRYRFSGDSVFKRVGDLSGGEQARVALAVLALQGANFLLLDEPTNHLDIPSQEVLQEVFSSFEGTVLMVTHDRYLIRALTERIWAITGDQLRVFYRGYDEYRTWLEKEREKRSAEKEERRQAYDAERRARRATQRDMEKQARRRAEVEEAIYQLEARKAELETALKEAGAARQVDEVAELGAEYSRLETELDAKLRLWEELA